MVCPVCPPNWNSQAQMQPRAKTPKPKYYPEWDPSMPWQQAEWGGKGRSQSPRPKPKQTDAPKGGPGKGKGKGKQKGKGKGKQNQLPPEPDWRQSPQLVESPAEPTDPNMKQLLTALRSHEVASVLPPHVQGLVQTAVTTTSRQSTKQLHSAVNALGKAKEHFQQCKDARMNLHIKWREHVKASVTRWQKYTSEFEEEDKKLEEAIEKSVEQLKQARETLNKSQDLAASASAVKEEELSDDEVSAGATNLKIRTDMQMLVHSLKQVQENCETSIQEMQTKKRRIDPGCIDLEKDADMPTEPPGAPLPATPAEAHTEGVSGPSASPSMVPFAAAGK